MGQFTRLVQVMPMRRIRSEDVPREFSGHRVFKRGLPKTFLLDSWQQFPSKYVRCVRRFLDITNLFSHTYSSQTDGQIEQ